MPLTALVAVPLMALGAATRYAAAAGVCCFYPRVAKALSALASASHAAPVCARLLRRGRAQPRPTAPATATGGRAGGGVLALGLRPFAVYGGMWAVLPLALPGLWRTVLYWQRFVPVVASYFGAGRRAARAARTGAPAAAEAVAEIWARQHDDAADAIFCVLCDLKGFYLKLAQILATKTDMLPKAYTDSLVRLLDKTDTLPRAYTDSFARLLDKMPPDSFSSVRRTIERELRSPLSSDFADVDPFPLASATVAQVHQATLRDGSRVVLKVQHRGTKGMMAADLLNMRVGVWALEALRLRLPFDLGSVVREYCEVLPREFDFVREGRSATEISASLSTHAAHFPLLRRVLVPRVYGGLTTPRLLTIEHIDGVPLLDIAHMDAGVKQELVSALVLAFGVQILRCGLFHTDPHPGNLLACASQGADDGQPAVMRLAMIDFGQVKRLSDASRIRYALLVLASPLSLSF
ncbi:hypothetical protein FOA52_009201 [Chlamydomonas sp. UWO 241]|nr:hypothetical protein FOA52_009201 [Chlamydomonas sp. UWO 241]